MSVLLWVVAVPLVVLLIGALFQAIGSAIDRRRYPPPGRLVPVTGAHLHAYSQGEGEPTIILESGIAASSLNWRAVQSELAQLTRVISYDRAGFGWSEAARTPRTIDNLVSELEKMIDALQIAGPLILVAHSFGSLIALAYCYRNPDRVVGLLLLDPIDCEHWRTLLPEGKERLAIGARLSRRGAWLARVGVVRFSLMLLSAGARTLPKWIARMAGGSGESIISRITAEISKMPSELLPTVRMHWSRPQSFETLAHYLSGLTLCMNEVTYASLGHLSLIVISAENATESELREHRKLVSLSRIGEHVIAERSGHWIQLDRPDLVVSSLQRSYGVSRNPSVPLLRR
ncbi:alpha/beta fold hydrolase [Edaphobacter aggregans]|uniref:alpha/beta fold hydrolase n=1 Tax=Edaphobacter aggregans TaxID=570835 RepID=UPI00146FD806|nr:alpha/beta fold hydrolase [Edaphobacter aggregans]